MPSSEISGPVDFAKNIDTGNAKGKTALITGGASGIGAGVAKALAEAGAHVTVVDVNAEAGEQYAAELSKEGLNIHFVQADVSDWHSQLSVFKSCLDNSPNHRIDLVIAAAGLNGTSVLRAHPFLSSSSPDSDPQPPPLTTLNVNLIGAHYTSCLAMHYFRTLTPAHTLTPHPTNHLILIASNIAYYPVPLFSDYSASKAGVRALWVSLRNHSHLTGMRTNLLAPHIIRTPMTKGMQPLLDEEGIEMVKLEDVVGVLMRLVCDEGVRGRAVGVNPGSGGFDFGDEVETYQGAMEFYKRHEAETKPVFDWIVPLMESGVVPAGAK